MMKSIAKSIIVKFPPVSWMQRHISRYIRKIIIHEYLVYGDESRLEISASAAVNNALFNLSSGKITVEDNAFFGHNVTILTGTHDYKHFGEKRKGSAPIFGRDVLIKQGVWIASNATIVGPCIVGEHSVVAACSLVNKDVPPFSIVAGVPAKVIKEIKSSVANLE